jgi:hypothetical protein
MAVALPREDPRRGRVRRTRVSLSGGAATTVYVVAHSERATELRVGLLRKPQRLEAWCAARGVEEALVGGFFVRPAGCRWASCAHTAWRAGTCRSRARGAACATASRASSARSTPEGFSAGQAQFDSDITDGRHPRAALGPADGRLIAVACDGRSRRDAGLTLGELAQLLARLGCHTALNLDGGGSTSMISGGRLRNRPFADVDVPEPGGRPVSTALLFLPR